MPSKALYKHYAICGTGGLHCPCCGGKGTRKKTYAKQAKKREREDHARQMLVEMKSELLFSRLFNQGEVV